MATTLYPTAVAPDYVDGSAPDGGSWYALATAYPETSYLVTNTLAGPVDTFDADALVTTEAGGTKMVFISPPVDAFTMDSTHHLLLRGRESNAAANVARICYRIGRLSGGTLTWNGGGGCKLTNEMPTSYSDSTSAASPVDPDPNPVFASGDQIVLEVFLDDYYGGDMASGYYVAHALGSTTGWVYNGETAITFQSWPSAPGAAILTPMRGIW